MKIGKIIFDKQFNATLSDSELDANLKPDEVLLKTKVSLVSPGTELAIYRGTESWAKLPYAPGYASIGEVVGKGPEVETLKEGDLVFCYNSHASMSKLGAKGLFAKVPAGVPLEEAVFARMAAVSMTALRVAPPELGDAVAVLGMGLVGNLAAQLFALSGAEVVCADICAKRLALAEKCGLGNLVDSSKEDLRQAVLGLTGGNGASTVVEATGVPAMAETAMTLAAKSGEVVLLGSPRGKHEGDITSLLNKIHLWSNGCVTLKGAHEWRYPCLPSEGTKHSLRRNCEIIMKLIADGKLKTAPLITHMISPAACQSVYQGLLNERDKYTGVVFDWSKI